MKEQQDKAPPRRDLVVVYITDNPKAAVLLRIARSHAVRIGGRWHAVFIEVPTPAESGSQGRMLRLITLAERMGAQTTHIEAEIAEKEIVKIIEAEREQIALLILGSEEKSRLITLHREPWERAAVYARKRHIAVEIIPLSGQKYRRSLPERFRFFRLQHIIYALLCVYVAYLSTLMLQRVLPPALFRINSQNIGLLFMTACAFAAGRFGLLPGLVASIASFYTINHYFTYYPLNIASITDLLNVSIFLFAALLISLFTSQTRGVAEKTARRERSLQVLFHLYRIATNASSRRQVLEDLQKQLVHTLDMEVAFFLPSATNSEDIESVFPSNLALDGNEMRALQLCWKEMKTTGLGSPFYSDASWRFEPMMAVSGEIGVLGVNPRLRSQLDIWFGRLLSAIAEQTSTVIEHIDLERSMEASRINEEREKLRSMLLSSVSHDLKTPLASIIGALAVYRSQSERLLPEKRAALIETALEEAERLDSFITNILDMTRLESRKIEFKQDWYDPFNLVQEVLKRMEYRMRHHQIKIYPCQQMIDVYMDPMMTGQVLQNVLDNACKYTHAGTSVDVYLIAHQGEGFCFEIRDYGSGIPSEKMHHIFDKYARLQMRDSQVAGTGLGLAICKTIMEVQGGAIRVSNHPEGGAVFTVYLPQWRMLDHHLNKNQLANVSFQSEEPKHSLQ